MFVNAIEKVSAFTRPIHTITRLYKETIVNPGAATFFFVNEFGCAVTCRHVIELVGHRDSINKQYREFQWERRQLTEGSAELKALEERYNYHYPEPIIQLQDLFLGVTSEPSMQYSWVSHPEHDLAIVIFENFKKPMYTSHAKFLKDSSQLKPGQFLCRLGFPFPEFTNFRYNVEFDMIEWTQEGQVESPVFPIEGMMTRSIATGYEVTGIELSTPGLRGQSGGPLFNADGLVCGMQSSTHHLHLGFDMNNYEHKIGARNVLVNNQPFLHVGRCIHMDVIKEFLAKNGIPYYEE